MRCVYHKIRAQGAQGARRIVLTFTVIFFFNNRIYTLIVLKKKFQFFNPNRLNKSVFSVVYRLYPDPLQFPSSELGSVHRLAGTCNGSETSVFN